MNVELDWPASRSRRRLTTQTGGKAGCLPEMRRAS